MQSKQAGVYPVSCATLYPECAHTEWVGWVCSYGFLMGVFVLSTVPIAYTGFVPTLSRDRMSLSFGSAWMKKYWVSFSYFLCYVGVQYIIMSKDGLFILSGCLYHSNYILTKCRGLYYLWIYVGWVFILTITITISRVWCLYKWGRWGGRLS